MSWGNEGRRDRPATTTAATHSLDDWGNPVSATPNSPANGQLSGNDNEHAINSHGNQNSSGHPNADIQTAPIATQWNENIDVEDSSGGPDAKGGDKTHLNNDGNGDTMGAPPRERAERPQRAETEIVTIEPPADGWAHNAARYEWDDTYGDVAPRHEKLEALLFKDPSARSVGIEFHSLMEINVTQESVVHIDPVFKFEDAGLHPAMLENIKLCGYEVPTPIQMYCLPSIKQNYDVLACAQTGSGKTAAFMIPILSKLMGKAKQLAHPRPVLGEKGYRCEPLVMIMAPTRELVTQIFDETRKFCYRSMLRPCVVYGGADLKTQRVELQKGCDVLVGTPGRLQDFVQRNNISLKRIKFVVVDEADEMLKLGFEGQLRKLMLTGDINNNDDLQVSMFSATFPRAVRKLARDFLSTDHVLLKVGRIGSTHKNITQRFFWVDDDQKQQAIYDLLCTAPPARTLVFAGNKRAVDTLDDYLYGKNLPTTAIHGSHSQREREDAIRAFRSGKCPILIATDVAARGLDIKNVMHVINYDLPKGIVDYVHRIGRTGRIGNKGLATTFYNHRSSELAPDLVQLLMENEQEVPDFMEEFRPEGGEINFDEPDTDLDEDSLGGLRGTDEHADPSDNNGADNPMPLNDITNFSNCNDAPWGCGTGEVAKNVSVNHG